MTPDEIRAVVREEIAKLDPGAKLLEELSGLRQEVAKLVVILGPETQTVEQRPISPVELFRTL